MRGWRRCSSMMARLKPICERKALLAPRYNILNQAGLKIPSVPGQTVSGADKSQYFFRVKTLLPFWNNAGAKLKSCSIHPRVAEP